MLDRLHSIRDESSGEIKGTMAFDRKDYGMTSGIPFMLL